MHIDPKEMIGSVPAALIRDICREYGRGIARFNQTHIAYAFKLSKERATECLNILLSRGYAVAEDDSGGSALYKLTSAGFKIGGASFRVYKRASCEKALTGLIERSRETARDPRFIYFVSEISVFGSFLEPKEKLSDVDLALSVMSKIADHDVRLAAERAYLRDAEKGGYYAGTLMQKLSYAWCQFFVFLRARSPILSFHDRSELDKIGAPFRCVYSYNPTQVELDGLAAMTCRHWEIDPANPLPDGRYI